MHGIGRTVFSGGTIEEFGVEVVDVIRGSRPKGSLILFRGSGEVLQHAGIIAGMSGSPVYIDGKLVGAVAFAYPFLKDPIGAITPIEEMLELDRYPLPDARDIEAMESGPVTGAGASGGLDAKMIRRPRRGPRAMPGSSRRSGRPSRGVRMRRAVGRRRRWPARSRPGLPPRSARARSRLAPGRTVATSHPVGVHRLDVHDAGRGPWPGRDGGLPCDGGFDPPWSKPAACAAGEAATLEPGSAMALELVGGDASIAAIGTVTAVDGDRVYAFGHPMVQGGPVAFPMFGARIHAVMPSLKLSAKMGSPTRALGGVWQDRRPGVLGLLGVVPPTIPVRVSISLPGRADEVYRYRIVRDPILTPMLLPWTVSNSYQHSGWSQGETTAQAAVEVYFDGGRSVRRSDLVVTDAPALGIGGSAILPASLLITNPYQRVRLDSLSVRVTAAPGHAAAEVIRLRCTPRRVGPGDTSGSRDHAAAVARCRDDPHGAVRRARRLGREAVARDRGGDGRVPRVGS